MVPDRSIFIGQKLAEKAKVERFKRDFFAIFKQCVNVPISVAACWTVFSSIISISLVEEVVVMVVVVVVLVVVVGEGISSIVMVLYTGLLTASLTASHRN